MIPRYICGKIKTEGAVYFPSTTYTSPFLGSDCRCCCCLCFSIAGCAHGHFNAGHPFLFFLLSTVLDCNTDTDKYAFRDGRVYSLDSKQLQRYCHFNKVNVTHIFCIPGRNTTAAHCTLFHSSRHTRKNINTHCGTKKWVSSIFPSFFFAGKK